MSDPIDTVAEALRMNLPDGFMDDTPFLAQTVLVSLAQHRDGIRRAIWSAPDGESDCAPCRFHAKQMADAVLAYLTGEAS